MFSFWTVMYLIFVGVIAGFVARLLVPGRDPIGFLWTIVLGIAGSFAGGFLASQLKVLGGKPLVQRLMGSADAGIELSDASWRHLNLMWVAYFVVLGFANLYVFRNFDEDTWVNFKLFGMLGLTLVFIVVQGMWVASRTQQGATKQ